MSTKAHTPQPDLDELTQLRSRLAEMEQQAEVRERELAELRRSEAQLRQTEQQQQQLIAAIESSSDFIATATADGRVTYLNEAGRRMIGLDDMDAVRRTVIPDYFSKEDAAYALEHIVPTVMKDGKWEGDFRFRHMKTGQTIPIFYSVFVVKDTASGELLGLGTVTRNITAQKQAEAEQRRLKQAEERQQQLIAAIESSSDFIATATVDGRVTYLNEAGRRMIGLVDMEEVQRTVIPDYFSKEDAAYALEHIVPTVMKDGRWEGDFRFRHMKTGQPIPIFYSVFVVKDTTSGQLLGLGTVTRNITAQKQAEAEQQRLKDEVIRVQEAALAELSTPLIPISDHVLVMPLIGSMDEGRAQRVIETLLHGVSARQARVAIVDITGVSTVDTRTADVLIQAAKAVQLLGASVVLTGIRADVAQTLIQLGADLSSLTTRGTLQDGIAYAMRNR